MQLGNQAARGKEIKEVRWCQFAVDLLHTKREKPQDAGILALDNLSLADLAALYLLLVADSLNLNTMRNSRHFSTFLGHDHDQNWVQNFVSRPVCTPPFQNKKIILHFRRCKRNKTRPTPMDKWAWVPLYKPKRRLYLSNCALPDVSGLLLVDMVLRRPSLRLIRGEGRIFAE